MRWLFLSWITSYLSLHYNYTSDMPSYLQSEKEDPTTVIEKQEWENSREEMERHLRKLRDFSISNWFWVIRRYSKSASWVYTAWQGGQTWARADRQLDLTFHFWNRVLAAWSFVYFVVTCWRCGCWNSISMRVICRYAVMTYTTVECSLDVYLGFFSKLWSNLLI